MGAPEVNKINRQHEVDPDGFVHNVNLENLPTINTIEDHYRSTIEDSEETFAEQGLELLINAGAKENHDEKPGLIDAEIQRVSADIRNERNKEKPNWTKIDYLVRQLAALLLRKAGKSDQELTQEEIDHMREDIEKVVKTYNTFWSLLTAVGSGGLTIIGGLIGVGGSIAGIVQMAGGAAKVSSMVSQATQMGQTMGQIGGGVGQALAGPVNANYERKRQEEQFNLQLSTNRRDTAQSSAGQNRNMQSGALSNLDRTNENLHTAAMRVISGTSS